MINEELKSKAENILKKYERIRMNKEDNVRGGMYITLVGFAGTMAGITIQSKSHIMAGLIVQTSGLLFQTFNNKKLEKITKSEEKLRYVLDNAEIFDIFEDEKGNIKIKDNTDENKPKKKHLKK